MFAPRGFIAPLLLPLALCLELLLTGLFLLWFTRQVKLGRSLVTVATTLLIVVSYTAPAGWMLRTLEYRHPTPLEVEERVTEAPPRWVVVLGGGFTPDPRLPVTSQLSPASLARIVEGVRLYKRFPGARVVVSGGADVTGAPEAIPIAIVAEMLGVPRRDLVLEDASRNTEEQAAYVAKIVGDQRFFLVTSASHMPRAFSLFAARRLNAVASPADYDIKAAAGWSPSSLYPQAENVRRADETAYEYLGMMWARLRGGI